MYIVFTKGFCNADQLTLEEGLSSLVILSNFNNTTIIYKLNLYIVVYAISKRTLFTELVCLFSQLSMASPSTVTVTMTINV